MAKNNNKYLIIQLACFGDCLYATAIAKQLKHDDPKCHITWAIASKYASVLNLNPFVDRVWEINIQDGDYYNENLLRTISEAEINKASKIFDRVIVSQIPNTNWHNFNGTIRGTILSASPNPITVDVSPVIRLTTEEISRVKSYVELLSLESYSHILLFECAPSSGQSVMTPAIALQIAEKVIDSRNDICIIMTSPSFVETPLAHIKDASLLTFRENAELAKYCTGLIGCSSGITWLSTSDWVGYKLPMIQLLSSSCMIYAGIEYEHTRYGLDTSQVVEIIDSSVEKAVAAIRCFLDCGIQKCKNDYHQVWRPSTTHYLHVTNFVQSPRRKLKIALLTFNYLKNNKHIPRIRLVFWGVQKMFSGNRMLRILSRAFSSS